MANVITVPKMTETMTSLSIKKWHVKVGDKVVESSLLATIETDHFTAELEVYEKS